MKYDIYKKSGEILKKTIIKKKLPNGVLNRFRASGSGVNSAKK